MLNFKFYLLLENLFFSKNLIYKRLLEMHSTW